MSIYVQNTPKAWTFSKECRYLSSWRPLYKRISHFNKTNEAYCVRFFLGNFTVNVRKIYRTYALDGRRPYQRDKRKKGKYKCLTMT